MKLYFIDLDGTIEDSKQDMSLCVNLVRKKLFLPEFEIEFVEKFVNKGMDELYKNCFFDYIEKNPTNYHVVKNEYEQCYFNNVCVHTKCYEGIPEALKFLSQNGKIVVVTNKPEKISRELLKKLNLSNYISDVMGGDSCAECKPSPLPLQIATEKLAFHDKENIFMIGDSEGDVKTAQAFGVKSVWCAWGYLKELTNLKADIVLHYPLELKNLI
ncbi:MAG: HAD-IA family hydrolase [Bdellovibrionota bacterium]